MYLIVWEYAVAPEKRAVFERHYNAQGTWAQFFSTAAGFVNTMLLEKTGGGYVTLDFWENKDAFDAFMAQQRERYEAIDRACEALTDSERCIGRFTASG